MFSADRSGRDRDHPAGPLVLRAVARAPGHRGSESRKPRRMLKTFVRSIPNPYLRAVLFLFAVSGALFAGWSAWQCSMPRYDLPSLGQSAQRAEDSFASTLSPPKSSGQPANSYQRPEDGTEPAALSGGATTVRAENQTAFTLPVANL